MSVITDSLAAITQKTVKSTPQNHYKESVLREWLCQSVHSKSLPSASFTTFYFHLKSFECIKKNYQYT